LSVFVGEGEGEREREREREIVFVYARDKENVSVCLREEMCVLLEREFVCVCVYV